MNNRYTINERVNFRSFATEKSKLNIVRMKQNYAMMDKFYREAPKGYIPKDFSWVKERTILNMDSGKYHVTDHIYNYELKVGNYESGDRYYRLKVKGALSGDTIVFLEYDDSYFEKGTSDFYRYDDPKVKRLSVMMSVGGMTIFSQDIYNLISNLTIIPRGTFKEYTQKEI